MPDREPEWLELILGPMHKIGVGLVTLLMTIAGLLVWFVIAPIKGLLYLGGKRGGKG